MGYFDWIEGHSGLAAWLQAGGAIVALIIAIGVPWVERRFERKRAREDNAATRQSLKARLVAALEQEIAMIDQIAGNHQEAVKAALEGDLSLRDQSTLPQLGWRLIDPIIYRAAAADLGALPPAILSSVVKFYSNASATEHMTTYCRDIVELCEMLQPSLPRLRMHAALVRVMLEKYRASNFDDNTNVTIPPEEIASMAKARGYPLADVIRERKQQS